MTKPLPYIRQSIPYLLKRLRAASNAALHQRLQMLYLFKSEQARTRVQASKLLGVNRATVQHWLTKYETGGLKGLLHIDIPPGATPALNDRAVERLRRRLSASDGFANYTEIQAWIQEQLRVSLSYAATFYWVNIKCGARPKVVRPSHIKKTSRRALPIQRS